MFQFKRVVLLILSVLCLAAMAQETTKTSAHEQDCVCIQGAGAATCSLCTEGKCSACKQGNCPLAKDKTFCTLKIDGMACGGCAEGAQSALLAVPGVVSAKIDLENGTGVVGYDPKRVTPDAIAKAKFPATQTVTLVKEEKADK